MVKKSFYAILMLMCSLMLTSCMKHDFDYSDNEKEQIKKNMEYVFKTTFDENHDWCTTVNGSVKVNIDVPGATIVRIAACVEYTGEEGEPVRDILVMNEASVAPTQTSVTLNYDAPKDVICIYAMAIATDGIHMQKFSTEDKEITISATEKRALTRATAGGFPIPDGTPVISSSISSYATDFGWVANDGRLYSSSTSSAVDMGSYDAEFTSLFRDVVFSYFKNGRKYQNLPLVKASGFYNASVYPITTGNAPVIVSPVYKNDGGYQEVENAELYYYYYKEENLGSDPVAYIQSLPKYQAMHLGDVFTHGKAGDDKIAKNSSFALMYFGDGTPSENQTGSFVFPAGYKIGFMIRSNYTGKEGDKRGELYGDGRLNNKVNKKSPFSSSKLGDDGPRMAWLTINGRLLLCCESGTDQDFNDVIFEIEGGIEGLIVVPDPEYNVYTYCFEDTPLGDYDLNDVVIKAERLSDTKVRYSIVACGANDELYIKNINAEAITDYVEVHAMFNCEQNTFINTVSAGQYEPIVSVKTVDKSFSFLNKDTQPYIYDKTINNKVELSKIGEDPHGIMIPYDFRWPREKVCVKDAYIQFNSWGRNSITSTDWYKDPNVENVI